MDRTTTATRPPLGVRLLSPLLSREPDWSAMTPDDLAAFRTAENRKRRSAAIRLIAGFPDRGAAITWQQVALDGRVLPVRVHRPGRGAGTGSAPLPLVLHVHGGGFVGTAPQSDWINSHLAARLPAVVVSVDHRLLTHRIPLSAAVDDGWDALQHLARYAAHWGIDADRIAVLGESAGATVAALSALRARGAGPDLRAQVLVNPCVDLTATALEYPSVTEHADSPTLTVPQIEFFRRLAVPEGVDPRTVSPLHAGDHGGLAPALVVVPTLDPLADHGRAYAERLLRAGSPARLSEHPGAVHAFLSLPRLVPRAEDARTDILRFLEEHLAP
ncbi:alpha/beta hydrolase [Nocardiopsis sp. HNM0947]|uniref:Alpha/beta hydrolase n=1 Tax=Nocardiopsis coralli TaxID=2772213 RepID=A0ABR9PBW5_9ACTN|nr:alpha/beta hydrolase [Nocardiopsis coralli]MBE3001332.1 alpha/beta hydrolase [Nocardiopsis coralli]